MAPNLPNPPATMTQALLTPETQYQVAISLCLAVGTLGAYIWDVLLHLGEEYKMLAKSRIRLGTVVYFSSRVWTLLALLGTTLFATYPLQNCELAITLTEVFWAIAVASTSFLFFLRARAIFNGKPWLISIFFCLWLSVAGTAAIVPTTVHAVNVGLTAYCIDDSISPAAISLGITPLLYHTVIFLAISWHLYRHSWSGDFWTFFTGKSLPSFSKALLKDGQFYYLLLVTLNTTTVAMFFNGQLAPAYRLAFAIPNLMLGNATACRIFRKTKLGFHERITTVASSGVVVFRASAAATGSMEAAHENTNLNGEARVTVSSSCQTLDVDDLDASARSHGKLQV